MMPEKSKKYWKEKLTPNSITSRALAGLMRLDIYN